MENKPQPFIEFHITEKCNYRCEYCVQGKGQENFKYKVGHASDDVIRAFLELLNSLEEPYEIKLIGGEPLVHPKFFEIVEEVAKTGNKINFGTNFSFPLESYKKIVDICQDQFCQIVSTLHLSQVKDVDEFINKAFEFNNYKHKDTNFVVTSVITEERFEKQKEIKKRLDTLGVKFSPQHLKEGGRFVEYLEEIKRFMNEMQPETSPLNQIKGKNFYGTICYTGYKFFNIYWDGNVYRCYNKQKNDIHKLGNIADGTFKPYKCPVPCLSESCGCVGPVAKNMIRFGEKAPVLLKELELCQKF